jgi:hypothetical protein
MDALDEWQQCGKLLHKAGYKLAYIIEILKDLYTDSRRHKWIVQMNLDQKVVGWCPGGMPIYAPRLTAARRSTPTAQPDPSVDGGSDSEASDSENESSEA